MLVTRRPIREVDVPELLRLGPNRYLFNSREHGPPHVHVISPGGRKAVFWLSPVSMDRTRGYTPRQIEEIRHVVITHRREFLRRWHEHFA
jgi:hypothetical protein